MAQIESYNAVARHIIRYNQSSLFGMQVGEERTVTYAHTMKVRVVRAEKGYVVYLPVTVPDPK